MLIKSSFLCKFIGHSWAYKELTEWLKSDGSVYTENKKRKCRRCGLREYVLRPGSQEWVGSAV